MNRRRWTTAALVFVGVSLIVGGGFMFSTYGWDQMGGSYSMACDTDELIGSNASAEGTCSPCSQQRTRSAFSPPGSKPASPAVSLLGFLCLLALAC